MRKRYQQGQVIDGGDRWEGRWREDLILPKGSPLLKGNTLLPNGEVVHRKRRWDVLAPKKGVTRRMAEQILADRIRGANENIPGASPIDQWLRVVGVELCNSCREQLISAFAAKGK